MIDIHSHVIYGVDDGPSAIIQSLQMIEEAEKLGIEKIVATPHYHENVFTLEHVEENYKELLYKARDYNVIINMGYEVFVNPGNQVLVENYDKLGICKSRVILIEFPFNASPQQCIELVQKLRLQNMVPIIAHIERNRAFLNKIEYIVAFIKAGCCIQLDMASIVGIYGLKIKEFSKKLLRLNLVDTVASNAHCAADYTKWYHTAYDNVLQWIGNEKADILFRGNAESILESDINYDFVYEKI